MTSRRAESVRERKEQITNVAKYNFTIQLNKQITAVTTTWDKTYSACSNHESQKIRQGCYGNGTTLKTDQKIVVYYGDLENNGIPLYGHPAT